MIIAIASDDGVKVVPLTDGSRAFVLFEVAQSTAARAGYRNNALNALNVAKHPTTRAKASDPGAERATLVETLSDCTAVIAREIDMDLRCALQGKAIETFVCGEENVDRAAQQYAASVPEAYEAGPPRRGPNA